MKIALDLKRNEACTPPLDGDGRLSADTPCIECGYNLRGLAPDGKCPECGKALEQSVGDDALRCRPLASLRRMIVGLYILIGATATTGATVLFTLLLGFSKKGEIAEGVLGIGLFAAVLSGTVGVFRVTLPAELEGGRFDRSSFRLLVRFAAIAAVVASLTMCVAMWSGFFGDRVSSRFVIKTFFFVAASYGILCAALLLYLAGLVVRTPRIKVARQLKFSAAGVGVSALMVCIGSVSAISDIGGMSDGNAVAMCGTWCGSALGVVCLPLILTDFILVRRAVSDELTIARGWRAVLSGS